MSTIPTWLEDNPTERKPTEVLIPLVTKVGPVWSHSQSTGGWYAGLEAGIPGLDIDDIWDCDHVHPTHDEAWDCANGAAMQVAEQVTMVRAQQQLADYLEIE